MKNYLNIILLGLEDLDVSAAHVLAIILKSLLDVPQRLHLNECATRGSAVAVLAEVNLLDAAVVEELDDLSLAGAEGQPPHPDNVTFLSHGTIVTLELLTESSESDKTQ